MKLSDLKKRGGKVRTPNFRTYRIALLDEKGNEVKGMNFEAMSDDDAMDFYDERFRTLLIKPAFKVRGTGERYPATSKKFKIGNWYVGRRKGSPSDMLSGKLVDCYYTVTKNGFKNYGYVLECKDGKRRSYNFIITSEGRDA